MFLLMLSRIQNGNVIVTSKPFIRRGMEGLRRSLVILCYTTYYHS
jgi:hypothetical protein